MSVWLTIPSARPPAECVPLFQKWHERGYKIAIFDDFGPTAVAKGADYYILDQYPGYATACNRLIREVMAKDLSAEWFICAGDDIEPDPSESAEYIAASCYDYFWGNPGSQFPQYEPPENHAGLFGVMQPTGDRWHEGVGGFANAPIDRVCGSAWYGREYCRRMYGGQGPLYPGYQHMFEDEEAQEVAIKMGVFWQRRDLVQRHNHWGRGATDDAVITMGPDTIPPHLRKWNTPEHWREAKALFESRKLAGFPGHEPIP
jgi:hypothetical protein